MNKTENNTSLINYRKYLIIICLFFAGYCFFLSSEFLFQNVDDAYISYRYGKNLMNGSGLVYNTGEYVEGYTNFLWTIIMAPFTKIPAIDVSVFSTTLCVIISLLNIFFITKISSQLKLFSDFKYFGIFLLPAIFYVLDDSIVFWAVGGMEFPIYILFILGTAYNYFRLNESNKYSNYLIACFILCTLTRPEGNMIFVLTMFHFLLFRKKVNNFRTIFTKISVLYLLFCIIYYGFKYLYYGQVIPNTFYAKGVTDFSMNLILGSKYIIRCVGIRLYVLIFILFIPFREVLKGLKISYLLLISAVYIIYILVVGGDWFYANRFFVPIIPFLYVLSALGLVFFFKRFKEFFLLRFNEKANKKLFIGFSAALCITLFTVTVTNLEYERLIKEADNANFEMHWSRFGQWLKMNSSPNTIIAVGPAGKIPYYSELYSIDMWGLNNETIARTKSKRRQAGHKKFDLEYVLSLNPEYIIGWYPEYNDDAIPERYEKFNAPDDYYKCHDIVIRLKPQYRKIQ